MSREPAPPQIVHADDARTRRDAARVAFLANLTTWSTWLLVGPLGVVVAGVTNWLGGVVVPPVVYPWWTFPAGWMLMSLAWSATLAVGAYFAHRGRGQLLYLRTDAAAASMIIRTDRRRGAAAGDIQAAALSAWPKGRGAGSELGDFARAIVHEQGGRITLTALPDKARAYVRHGFAADGYQPPIPLLTRMASRPAEQPR